MQTSSTRSSRSCLIRQLMGATVCDIACRRAFPLYRIADFVLAYAYSNTPTVYTMQNMEYRIKFQTILTVFAAGRYKLMMIYWMENLTKHIWECRPSSGRGIFWVYIWASSVLNFILNLFGVLLHTFLDISNILPIYSHEEIIVSL